MQRGSARPPKQGKLSPKKGKPSKKDYGARGKGKPPGFPRKPAMEPIVGLEDLADTQRLWAKDHTEEADIERDVKRPKLGETLDLECEGLSSSGKVGSWSILL